MTETENTNAAHECHGPAASDSPEAVGPDARLASVVLSDRVVSSRTKLAVGMGGVGVLTYLLLASNPWSLFGVLPETTARVLKKGPLDKVYHLLAYFLLTCTLMWYAAARSRQALFLLSGAVAIHGLVIELLQQFVPRRTTDVEDVIANLSGTGAGLAAGLLLQKTLEKESVGGPGMSITGEGNRQGGNDSGGRQSGSRWADAVSGSVSGTASGSAITFRLAEVVSPSEASAVGNGLGIHRERIQLTADEIGQVRPREVNFRFLGSLVVVIAVMSVSLCAVHGWQVQRNTGRLLQRARQAREAGYGQKALTLYHQYCRFVPDDINALAGYGLLRDDLRNRPAGARSVFLVFEKVLRRDPARDDIRRRLVTAAMELGRYTDALSHIRTLRQAHPTEGELDYLAGNCFEKLNDFEKAAEAYRTAIDKTPEAIDAWARLASLTAHEFEQPQQAEMLMERLAEINGSAPHVWLTRARFHLSTGQFDLAGQDMERAVELAADHPVVLITAGEIGYARAVQARSEGRLPRAERIAADTLSLLNRGVELHPELIDLKVRRIVLEAEFGRAERALALIDNLQAKRGPGRADELSRNEVRLLQLLAELSIEQGRFEKATHALGRIPRSPDTDGLRHFFKGRIAVAEGRREDAVTRFQHAREVLANSPRLLEKTELELADCYLQLDRLDEAIAAFRSVLKHSPQSIPAQIGLAEMLANSGNMTEALPEYRAVAHLPAVRLPFARLLVSYNAGLPELVQNWDEVTTLLDAAEQDGADPVEVAVIRADMFLRREQFDRARSVLESVYRSRPQDPALLTMLERIRSAAGSGEHEDVLVEQVVSSAQDGKHIETQLRRTLKDDPASGQAAQALMQLLLQQDRRDEAIELFREYAAGMSRLELARTYEIFGDVRQAFELLQAELGSRPDSVEVVNSLARLYEKQGHPARAEPLYQRVIELTGSAPDRVTHEARRRLAVILAGRGSYRDWQRAVELMERNATEKPVIPTTDLRARSIVMAHSSRRSDARLAISLLERIEDRGQLEPEDRWRLAALYDEAGDAEKARLQFERAAQAGLATPEFFNGFISHLIRKREFAGAEERIEQLPPEMADPTGLRLKIRLSAARGGTDRTAARIGEYVELARDRQEQARRLAEAAGLIGRFQKLTSMEGQYLHRAVDADPAQVGALVRWLLDRGRDVEAFEHFDTVWTHLSPESAAELSLVMLRSGATRNRREMIRRRLTEAAGAHPENLSLKRFLADLESFEENYARAAELYREIIYKEPYDVPALNALAWMQAMRGRLFNESAGLIDRAMKEAGPKPQLLATRGSLNLMQSRLRSALADLTKATETDPAPATLLYLAAVHQESGRPVEARRTLRQAESSGLNPAGLHPLNRELLKRLRREVGSDASGNRTRRIGNDA